MTPPATLLLCHHGTAGAARAEALAHRVAAPGVTRIVHCLVVPDLWAGMQGDDWLNNAATRDVFAHYVEDMLERDARAELVAVESRCRARGCDYDARLLVGDPATCAVEAGRAVAAELVVIGPPRAPGVDGLRSRMDLETLVRGLPCPLLVAQ